jgi:hypothetical protein
MVKAIAGRLNEQVPPPFRACETVRLGPCPAIDVDTVVARVDGADPLPKWSPPKPRASAPFSFPDSFEVRIYEGPSSWYLVGTVVLIGPSNKESPEHRRAFAMRCVSLIQQGVSVVALDIVNGPQANLHNAILDHLKFVRPGPSAEDALYAATYRPVIRERRNEVDIWYQPCRLGAELPTMPLRLTGDDFVPVEFEFTYNEALRALEVS